MTSPKVFIAVDLGAGSGRVIAADGVRLLVSVDCGIRSQAAARRARELGVDIATVRGTGPGGRITMDDVRESGQGARVRGGGSIAAEPKELPDFARYGEVTTLPMSNIRRVIAEPSWSADMSDFRKLGGWGIDLHIHDNHFIGLLCGTPKAVFSRGLLMEGLVNHVSTQYLFYDPNLTVSCISGGIAAAGLKFGHSFELFLEKATIQFDAGTYGDSWVVNRPLTLITSEGQVTNPTPGGGTEWCAAFTDELQTAVDGVASGKEPRILSGQLALDALRICLAEAESIAKEQPVSL